jgi:hypothetical protein
MQRESSNLEPGVRESRTHRVRRDALETLLEARDRLIAQMASEIRAQRDVILDQSTGEDSLFSFELQEIEDRYSARLHALNSILENLENLEFRRPRSAHKIETLTTTRDHLHEDLNALVSQFDQWDLVDINVTELKDLQLLAVVSFTADDYGEGDERFAQ